MAEEKTNLATKLLNIQSELKAPKNQHNNFGNYNYRSAEDIIEAVKPLCQKYRIVMTISDDVVFINNANYVKSVVTIVDVDAPTETISTYGMAREAASKKGMDDSQITGAASSYARKYALNGMFAIDDTKDADTLNSNAGYTAPPPQKIICKKCGVEILPLKGKDDKMHAAAEISQMNGGLCVKCFKESRG